MTRAVDACLDDASPSLNPFFVILCNSRIRLACKLNFDDVEHCYTCRGGAVLSGRVLRKILPNAYGTDGADLDSVEPDEAFTQLGWALVP